MRNHYHLVIETPNPNLVGSRGHLTWLLQQSRSNGLAKEPLPDQPTLPM